MSDRLRLRGDDVQVRVTMDAALLKTVVNIKSAEFIIKVDKKLERYLGRSGQSTDSQFSHVEGNLMFHPKDPEFLDLYDRAAKRAQRQTAQLSVKFGISATLSWPSGPKTRVFVPDLDFGDLPIRIGGGDQYVEGNLDWISESYKLQFV